MMPRGADPQREKEYEELVDQFHEQHRYAGREDEVAARIVNKQRSQFGETKEAEREDSEGESPDRDLPIPDYDHLDVDSIVAKLDGMSESDKRKIEEYEKSHHNRKTLLEHLA